MFTLRQRPVGITLCSHWLNPLLPLHGLHIFPVLQDFKKRTEGDKERKKEREKSKRAASPSYYMWIFSGTAVCVCTWRGLMYKQEHQQSDNKFFRGLWTPNSFLHRSHGICTPCRFYCYSQLMLNNRQLLILNVASVWQMNVQIAMQITKCALVDWQL